MEVTRSNFRQLLPEIQKTIEDATFLSIDGEFTGLHSGPEVNAYDTLSEAFKKIRNGTKHFLLVQFGLCAFRYDSESSSYKQSCYNFYIFPYPIPNCPDKRFMCQASSINFLASKNFDFNKLFNEGISYLSKPDEERFREILVDRRKARDSKASDEDYNEMKIPPNEQPKIDLICERIEDMLASSDPDAELILDDYNSFIRRIIYNNVVKKFSGKITVDRKKNSEGKFQVVIKPMGSEEEQERKEQEKQNEENTEFEDAIGMSTVIKLISQRRKLVIGHNILLDIMHTINQFLYPIPDSYQDFKDLTHCMFPRLIDTKVMASTETFKDLIDSTVLAALLNNFEKSPFAIPSVAIENNAKGYLRGEDKYHEAAFDAFITGLCFISMANYLGKKANKTEPILPDSEILKPFLNKIFIQKLADIGYISTDGRDPNPTRDHVMYMTFPKQWNNDKINELFSPCYIQIVWISETSAYVALANRGPARKMVRNLEDSKEYTLMTYYSYKRLQNSDTSLEEQSAISKLTGAFTSPSKDARKRKHVPKNKSSPNESTVETVPEHKEVAETSKKSPVTVNVFEPGNKKKCKGKSAKNDSDKSFDECDDWD